MGLRCAKRRLEVPAGERGRKARPLKVAGLGPSFSPFLSPEKFSPAFLPHSEQGTRLAGRSGRPPGAHKAALSGERQRRSEAERAATVAGVWTRTFFGRLYKLPYSCGTLNSGPEAGRAQGRRSGPEAGGREAQAQEPAPPSRGEGKGDDEVEEVVEEEEEARRRRGRGGGGGGGGRGGAAAGSGPGRWRRRSGRRRRRRSRAAVDRRWDPRGRDPKAPPRPSAAAADKGACRRRGGRVLHPP